MTRNEVFVFGSILNALNIDPHMLRSSDGFMQTQGQVFLLQETGFPTRYKYDHNIWGPISEEVGELITEWKSDTYAQSLMHGFKPNVEFQTFFDRVQLLRQDLNVPLSWHSADWIGMMAGVCWYTRTFSRIGFYLPVDHSEVKRVKDEILDFIPGYPEIDSNFPLIWNKLSLAYPNRTGNSN